MYTPPLKIMRNYAAVLVDFALNNGHGLKSGETVYLASEIPGLPLAKEVYRKVLEKGGHVLDHIIDDDFTKIFLKHGSEAQLTFYPHHYYNGLADTIDHNIRILGEQDPLFLKDVPPQNIMLSRLTMKPFRNLIFKKEDEGRFSWTLCLYGTSGMAKEAGVDERQYWEQIIQACFLDTDDPVSHCRRVDENIKESIQKLNALPIKQLHVKGADTDLLVALGEKRQWIGGGGNNIPSFEIFTSPDWRDTEGYIRFDMPLYHHGTIIEDIILEFKKGVIIKATAKKNEHVLHEMIKQQNADKIGEFSLTDRRFSRINRFMANSLYDENFGGANGNTHIAIGRAYHECYAGDVKSLTDRDFDNLGFNDSVEHADIIQTTDREVTAILVDGSRRVIYRGGEFVL